MSQQSEKVCKMYVVKEWRSEEDFIGTNFLESILDAIELAVRTARKGNYKIEVCEILYSTTGQIGELSIFSHKND